MGGPAAAMADAKADTKRQEEHQKDAIKYHSIAVKQLATANMDHKRCKLPIEKKMAQTEINDAKKAVTEGSLAVSLTDHEVEVMRKAEKALVIMIKKYEEHKKA